MVIWREGRCAFPAYFYLLFTPKLSLTNQKIYVIIIKNVSNFLKLLNGGLTNMLTYDIIIQGYKATRLQGG